MLELVQYARMHDSVRAFEEIHSYDCVTTGVGSAVILVIVLSLDCGLPSDEN